MITKLPTKEEFSKSNTLKHLVATGENAVLSLGKKRLKRYAEELGYREKYPWIWDALFSGLNSIQWAKKYPDQLEAAESDSCAHLRKGRTPLIYAMDLYAGWIVEDIISDILLKLGFETRRNGTDSCRKILSNGVKNDSDLEIKSPKTGNWYPFEISLCYKISAQKYGCFHLRDDKYPHLIADKAILFHAELLSRFFVMFIPFLDEKSYSVTHLDHFEPWNGKPAYEIPIRDEKVRHKLGEFGKMVSFCIGRMDDYMSSRKDTAVQEPPKEQKKQTVQKPIIKEHTEQLDDDSFSDFGFA